MRIVQIIDSLEAGGAERMAVNYANSLANKIDFSGIVVTRSEGLLLHKINSNVDYFFLNKSKTIDFKALLKLRSYIKRNKIEIVHAHSTSFFLAFLLKLIIPKVKLIWHDHYGDSEFLAERPIMALKFTIPFFYGIISVNQKLKVWSKQKLKFENVIYLHNFPCFEDEQLETTILAGEDGKRIVCLANLRPQKNHFLLLNVAKKLNKMEPNWTFHLVGKDFEDEYSLKIKAKIFDFQLQNHVFLYNSKSDIKNILGQANIAVLTSQSEGLPVAILEYGLNFKAVISTSVGEIQDIICNGENGFLIANDNISEFYDALNILIQNPKLITTFGENLNATIRSKFNSEIIVKTYLDWLKKSTNA